MFTIQTTFILYVEFSDDSTQNFIVPKHKLVDAVDLFISNGAKVINISLDLVTRPEFSK